jgi:hypothetical protein
MNLCGSMYTFLCIPDLSIFQNNRKIDIRSSKRMLTEWDNVLRHRRDSLKLWDAYLAYRLGAVGSFSVSGYMQAFEECVNVFVEDERREVLDQSLKGMDLNNESILFSFKHGIWV